MREFDYIIIGGGCAGLLLAYELEINEKLKNKTLAIIEPRTEYKKDKTWSFWKVANHNFEDCVKKSWENFTVNIAKKTNHLECVDYPYQSVDSGLFYEKINTKLKENKNISIFKNMSEINSKNNRFYIGKNFEEISSTINLADTFYKNSFYSIKDIPISFRFSILVARRVYRKIGHKILNKKNLENYQNSGKIYVSNTEKILETFLSIFDLIKLSFSFKKDDQIQHDHNLINEEINLDERI